MSTPYDSFFRASGAKWGVPAWLLEAIARTESGLSARAVVYEQRIDESSVGLMQLLESTARGLGFSGTVEQLLDPRTNIELGAQYVAGIIRRQGGIDLPALYSEYNSGSAALWRTSNQVRQHVRNFLRCVAEALGMNTAQFSFDDVTSAGHALLDAAETAGGGGKFPLVLALALGWAAFRRKKNA